MLTMEVPKPLSPTATINAFVPDSTALWVVVYAGPCLTNDCEVKDKQHAQLYMVPMVGWLHVIDENTTEVRPAVMTSNGRIVDYLELPDKLKFVAVLQDTEDATDAAYAIYRQRYGADAVLDAQPATLPTLSN